MDCYLAFHAESSHLCFSSCCPNVVWCERSEEIPREVLEVKQYNQTVPLGVLFVTGQAQPEVVHLEHLVYLVRPIDEVRWKLEIIIVSKTL